ncbi:MAG: Gfo/Idh/MocA family oxidoreductase [Lentisphaeria bacterium]
MRNNKLVAGVIGCGAFAWSQDFLNLAANPHCVTKYCCDLSLERAQATAEKFNVPKATSHLEEILDDPEVDLIKISTSHEAHLPIIEAAAARGKHIFCEKPMALLENEALAIIRAVRKHKVKLCVDMNRRMSPSMHALQKAWQAQCRSPKHQPWRYIEKERPQLAEEKVTHFLMNIQDESSSYRTIHLDPFHGGGEILGETTHWLDLACWFFASQRPVEILAWGSPRLSHGINLKFEKGDSASIIFSCCGSFDFPKEMYQITSNGALFCNNFFVENKYYGIPDAKDEIFPLQFDGHPDIGNQGGLDGYLAKAEAQRRNCNNLKFAPAPLLVDKGHRNMLDTFVEAIRNDTPSPCDELAGWTAVYLALLAIQSIELRHALPVQVHKLEPCLVV